MTPLLFGALWVIAASITAILPMRSQMIPGLTLLCAAPVLLIWIGMSLGMVWVALGTFAFLSMFRHPLNYLIRKTLRLALPSLPPELQSRFRPKS